MREYLAQKRPFLQRWVLGLAVPFLMLTAAILSPVTVSAEEPDAEAPRLRQLELEQLMNIKVSTVSRSASTVGESAAAVAVISQEDIRRSGATTIAELFRRVPGMDVARIDGNKWAISSRGFNDRYADMLLVQVDGRTVYNPLFTGVYWDTVVYPLEDIERIEVVRGPGASVWGANAVNGVINIITKSAKDTQGGLLSGAGGTEDRAFGTFRYGAKLGDHAWYRAYAEGFDRWTGEYSKGNPNDKWWVTDAGSRVDWDYDRDNALTFDWQYVHAKTGRSDLYPLLTPPFAFRDEEREVTDAGHVLGRWSHTISQQSAFTLQLYWDHFEQDIHNLDQDLHWDTYDLDFQHNFPLGERHSVTYGLGYRLIDTFFSQSRVDNGFIFSWRHPQRDSQVFSAFAQDQVALVREALHLLVGVKLEHNDFTGLEVQPTGRLIWTIDAQQRAWLAVSRAVRTPSLLEESVLLTLPPVATSPVVAYPRLTFNTSFASEQVVAYEAGYRVQPAGGPSIDLATFYNHYHNLRLGDFQGPSAGPNGSVIVPLTFENKMKAETYGVELAADWRPVPWLRLYGTYTFLEMSLYADKSLPPQTIAAAQSTEGHSPQHQVYLQSSFDLPRNVEFDLMGRYVSKLTGFNPDQTPGFPDSIDAYLSLDARAAWRPMKNLELSLVGQNLLQDHHAEFSSSPQGQILKNPLAEIKRCFYGQVKWVF